MLNKMVGILDARKILTGFVAGGFVAAGTLVAHAAPPGPLPFGAYDPEGSFSADKNVQIEHLFLPWEDVDLQSLPAADSYARARNRTLLVTVEPWTWTRDARNTPRALQRGISSGRFDKNMRQICGALGSLKSEVTVRWAHEMENIEGRFTWSNWEPETYINAFRRIVDECRKSAPAVKIMWSPLGLENLKDYYPGDDYLDVVGLTVFGLQKWDREKFGRDRTFKEVLKPGYDEAVRFGKPVVVAELGYVGDADYVANWENSVRQLHPEFPELNAVVYFNQKEVYPWPDNFGLPDWRVGSRITN